MKKHAQLAAGLCLALLAAGVVRAESQPLPRAAIVPAGQAVPWIDVHRAAFFAQVRRNELPTLMNIGSASIGASFPDLDAKVEEAEHEFEVYRAEHPTLNERDLFRQFAKNHAGVAKFLTEVDKHRVKVASAVQEGIVPLGLSFHPWELSLHPNEASRLVFSAVMLGSEAFSGIEIQTVRGVRFDGLTRTASHRRLVVIHDSKRGEQIETLIDSGDGGNVVHRTIYSESNGALILDETL